MINFGTPPTKGGGASSGIKGLIQGMQMGEQSRMVNAQNERANKQDTRADEQLGMMKKEFELKDLATRGAMFNPIMYAAEKSGNYDAVNTWLKDPNNKAFGGGSIQDSLMHDTKSNEFLNKYRGDTGAGYVEGQGVKTYTDGEGNTRYFTPDTFANGSGYGKYRRDAQLSDLALQAKIAKSKGGEKFDKNKTRNDAILNISNLTNDDMFKEANTKLKAGGDLDTEYFGKLQAWENQSDNKFKDAPLDATITGLADMNQAYADVNDMYEKEGFNSGITKSMASEIVKLGADDSDLTPKQQMKQFNTIIMKSKLGGAMSRYLKAISGSAVTEEEFLRTMKNAVGGDLSKVNAQTIMTAMKSTIDSMGKTTQEQIEGIQPGTPASKMWRQSRYNKAMNPRGSNPEFTPREKSGKLGIEDAGIKAGEEEVEALADFGGSAVKAGADIITKPIIKKVEETYNDTKDFLGLGGDATNPNPDAVYDFGNKVVDQVKNLGSKGVTELKRIQALIDSKKITRGEATKQLAEFLDEQPSSFGS